MPLAAVGVTAGAPQFVYPEQGKPCGKSHQNHGVGGAESGFHAAAVLFIRHPLLYLCLGFFNLFLVHVGYDPVRMVQAQ